MQASGNSLLILRFARVFTVDERVREKKTKCEFTMRQPRKRKATHLEANKEQVIFLSKRIVDTVLQCCQQNTTNSAIARGEESRRSIVRSFPDV
jgi:hypothetical protein